MAKILVMSGLGFIGANQSQLVSICLNGIALPFP